MHCDVVFSFVTDILNIEILGLKAHRNFVSLSLYIRWHSTLHPPPLRLAGINLITRVFSVFKMERRGGERGPWQTAEYAILKSTDGKPSAILKKSGFPVGEIRSATFQGSYRDEAGQDFVAFLFMDKVT